MSWSGDDVLTAGAAVARSNCTRWRKARCPTRWSSTARGDGIGTTLLGEEAGVAIDLSAYGSADLAGAIAASSVSVNHLQAFGTPVTITVVARGAAAYRSRKRRGPSTTSSDRGRAR